MERKLLLRATTKEDLGESPTVILWPQRVESIGKKILVHYVHGEHITHYCQTLRCKQNWTCRQPHNALRSPPSFITQHPVLICCEGRLFSDALILKSDLPSSLTIKSYFCPRCWVGLLMIRLYKILLPVPSLITHTLSGISLKTTHMRHPCYGSKQLPSTTAYTDYNRAASCQVTSEGFLGCHHDSSLPYYIIPTRSLPYSVSITLERLSM